MRQTFICCLDRNTQIQQIVLMPKVQITIVPIEVGQLWDEILNDVLDDVCNPVKQIPIASLPELIPHTYNQKYNLYQGRCHQQHTSNLCGYHAIFNSLCFLNTIKRGESHYNILSGSSFWRFKKQVEKFLFGIKRRYQLAEEWPWRVNDILYGDFQRTYNKLCLQKFEEFQIFRKHQQFELYSFTWQFQYQNLLINQQKKRQLNKLIQHFRNYNNLKPMVISFMLAITNHWMCLNAVKVGKETQYWFFDSFNRHVLDLSEKEIYQLVEHLDSERVRYRKEPFTPFFKQNLPICYMDTQITLKLIVDCLEGRTTIQKYTYNQAFNIFANKLEQYWEKDEKMLIATVKEYWYNISSFLRYQVQFHLFTAENNARFNKFVRAAQGIKSRSEEGKRLYQLVKKYETQICM